MRALGTATASLVHRDGFVVTSETRCQVIDITRRVEEAIRDAGVESGVALVNSLHTTCSIIVAAIAPSGIVARLRRLIPDDGPYLHNDVRWSDCERGNAAAHLRASLLGHGVTIGIVEAMPALEASHSIFLAEWDGPRFRKVDIRILGI